MSILPVVYVISSLLASFFGKYKHQTLISSMFLLGIAFVFTGPSKELLPFLEMNKIYVYLAQAVMGFGMGFIYSLV